MKNTIQFKELSFEELNETNGGNLFYDLAYAIGATAKSVVYFCQKASEFQSSLPPNLKK